MARTGFRCLLWFCMPLTFLACSSPSESTGTKDSGTFQGIHVFDPTAGFRDRARLHAEVEEQIRGCMKVEGFDYPLQPYKHIYRDSVIKDLGQDDERLTPEEYAQRYGFGVITLQEFSFVEAPQADAEIAALEAEANPLLVLLESMPPAEAQAFERTLYGPSDDEDDLGCEGRALEETNDALYPSVPREEVDRALLNYSTDLRVLDYYRGWSQCLALEGYQFESPVQALLALRSEATVALRQRTQQAYQEAVDNEINLAIAATACGAPTDDLLPSELEEIWSDYD